ncbi:MAG: hypothetical protein V4696_02425 [Pseudomonadota bacterium]
MSKAQDRGQYDWLVELAGALVPAGTAGIAAMLLAPSYGLSPEAALLAGFGGMFVLALASMRAVPAEPRRLNLPAFEPMTLPTCVMDDAELSLHQFLGSEDELLLDQPLVQPAEMAAVAELLLDDPLPAPPVESRVVQLFATGRMPTAGQLQQRIDRHLTAGDRLPDAAQDASDAFSEALAELRRSLRQA